MSTRTSPGAYRDPNKIRGKALMQAEIACLSNAGVPRSLTEIVTLGRTHKRRDGDILAYFDHPHTSNGPTGAINGRLEHLRRSALGFRNLTHYITRTLLKTGGFRPWSGLVLWTGCFEGCWLLLVVLCPLARVLVG